MNVIQIHFSIFVFQSPIQDPWLRFGLLSIVTCWLKIVLQQHTTSTDYICHRLLTPANQPKLFFLPSTDF
jgi:hypothetical protein